MNTYRPKEFAKLIAKTTNTLQRWDREGILKAHRTPTNRRFYTYEQLSEILGVKENKRIAISYCRVSSAGQKDDLLTQQKAVDDFCTNAGIAIDEAITEVGGGLNLILFLVSFIWIAPLQKNHQGCYQ